MNYGRALESAGQSIEAIATLREAAATGTLYRVKALLDAGADLVIDSVADLVPALEQAP